jgi:hypothetical protein
MRGYSPHGRVSLETPFNILRDPDLKRLFQTGIAVSLSLTTELSRDGKGMWPVHRGTLAWTLVIRQRMFACKHATVC